MLIKLFENYNQIKEISDLANDIFKEAAKKIRDEALEYKKAGKQGFLFVPPVYLRNINHTKFTILKDFIKNTELVVKHESKDKASIRGNYFRNDEDQHNITIFFDMKGLLKDINDKYLKLHKNDDLDEYYDYYFTLYLHGHDTLIHELQHAYDSYRSNGKFVNTRFNNDLKKIDFISKKKEGTLTQDEINLIEKNRKEYFGIQHEVNARYTQALKETSFYNVGSGFHNFTPKPFKDVLEDFLLNFTSWEYLSNKMKKRVKNRLYKDWIIFNNEFEKENKNSENNI